MSHHSIALHGVPGTPISGEYVRMTGALNRALNTPGARKPGPMNCSGCGQFVWGADCGLIWDDWCGGWEADPWCKRCRGKTE